jgi:hypothetical protein
LNTRTSCTWPIGCIFADIISVFFEFENVTHLNTADLSQRTAYANIYINYLFRYFQDTEGMPLVCVGASSYVLIMVCSYPDERRGNPYRLEELGFFSDS